MWQNEVEEGGSFWIDNIEGMLFVFLRNANFFALGSESSTEDKKDTELVVCDVLSFLFLKMHRIEDPLLPNCFIVVFLLVLEWEIPNHVIN